MLGWCHGAAGWGGWTAMTLTMVAFWAVVIFAAVLIWRGAASTRSEARTAADPRGVLDERFARGEIDEREYRQRRDVLLSLVH